MLGVEYNNKNKNKNNNKKNIKDNNSLHLGKVNPKYCGKHNNIRVYISIFEFSSTLIGFYATECYTSYTIT